MIRIAGIEFKSDSLMAIQRGIALSSVFVICLTLFFFILFSQFGSRIQASSSFFWWLLAASCLLGSIRPDLLLPVAHFFGVALVSNFILGAVVCFLLMIVAEQRADHTSMSRRFRDLISAQAVAAFDAKNILRSEEKKSVMIILPTYNEEENVLNMCQRLETLRTTCAEFSISYCFVNDGSRDRTLKLLQKHAPYSHTNHTINIGVAGVLLTGIRICRQLDFDIMVQCDSDGQHPVDQIPRICRELIEQNADLVVGSRYAANGGSYSDSSTYARRIGSLVLIQALRLFGLNNKFTDPTSGFRAYSPKAMALLSMHMPDEYPEPETLAIFKSHNLKIAEIFVSMTKREAGESSISGLKAAQFMVKVLTAIIGLRLRTLLPT